MSVPRRDIVQPIIDRHREPIVTAVHGAWDDWLNSPHLGVWRCKRSRANLGVWEQIIERAHLAFDGSPGRPYHQRSMRRFKFLLDDQVLFRFKKGNEAGLSVNVPTKLALAFHNHNQDLLGLADVHRVEVVYQLNWLETEIFDVIVVGRDEDVCCLVLRPASTLLQRSYRCPCRPPSDGLPATPVRHLVRPRVASETRDRNRQG